MPGVDWETCMTLNTTWGYSDHDHAWKTDETLIRNLIDIASKGGNYLLNIGPRGDGSMPAETIASFKAIGAWMKTNSASIYGTTASPFAKLDWGRCTRRGQMLYLHVFQWPTDGNLLVPLKNTAARGTLLARPEQALYTVATPAGLLIQVPAQAPDAIATVIALDLDGEPAVIGNALTAK
jgi:alpha-L-fucosidase